MKRCLPLPAVEKRKGNSKYFGLEKSWLCFFLDLKSKSGMPSLFGLGTSWSTIALSAATTSWIFALNAKLIRLQSPLRSAQWLGECVTMLFTSIASLAGWRLDKFVLWTTEIGNSRNTVTKYAPYPFFNPLDYLINKELEQYHHSSSIQDFVSGFFKVSKTIVFSRSF